MSPVLFTEKRREEGTRRPGEEGTTKRKYTVSSM
jgi:hypothetical protein